MCRCFSLLFLLLFCIQFADAQSSFDINVGFGAAQAKALGSVDLNTFEPCTTGSTACGNTSSLNNFMLGFGANLMAWSHFGVGGEVEVQPARHDYLTFTQQSAGQPFSDVLQTRVTFYEFNGIFQPVASKKASLQLVGGIGGAHVTFYEKQAINSSVLGNSQQTQFFGTANHFQVHGGVGVQFYLTDHVFIRPQFDVHYVNNFSQFGRNLVTQEMVWLGYSLGRQ